MAEAVWLSLGINADFWLWLTWQCSRAWKGQSGWINRKDSYPQSTKQCLGGPTGQLISQEAAEICLSSCVMYTRETFDSWHTRQHPPGCCMHVHTTDIHCHEQHNWKEHLPLKNWPSHHQATLWSLTGGSASGLCIPRSNYCYAGWLHPRFAYTISQGFSRHSIKCHHNSKWTNPKVIILQQSAERNSAELGGVKSWAQWVECPCDLS